ncbi:MAG: amidase family protein, partial [Solirubrobacterales bacterium]|nr:amidase family protein [Solirubrobacterales bacterium]
LETRGDELSDYEFKSLREASLLTPEQIEAGHLELARYRERIDRLFEEYDLICTPTVAAPAFEIGRRPRKLDGERVSALWGAFPFTVPFNVGRTTAATLPCGLVAGMPVGLQLVAAPGAEAMLLDVCEQLEAELAFARSPVIDRWIDVASSRQSEPV